MNKIVMKNNLLLLVFCFMMIYITIDSYKTYKILKIDDIKINDNIEIGLNEKVSNELVEMLVSDAYPVGSIYMSTTDDTVDKVSAKFGGTWKKYSEGRKLIGANSNYAVDSQGGVKAITLTKNNIPSHDHSFKSTATVTSSFQGNSVGTSADGSHNHTIYGFQYGNTDSATRLSLQGDGNFCSYKPPATGLWCAYSSGGGSTYRSIHFGWDGSNTSSNGGHYHGYTASGNITSTFNGTATNTDTCKNCIANSFSVINPYTVVYMYKRIK